jgi:hypothetical protein
MRAYRSVRENYQLLAELGLGRTAALVGRNVAKRGKVAGVES